jgi:hypothetical protein
MVTQAIIMAHHIIVIMILIMVIMILLIVTIIIATLATIVIHTAIILQIMAVLILQLMMELIPIPARQLLVHEDLDHPFLIMPISKTMILKEEIVILPVAQMEKVMRVAE